MKMWTLQQEVRDFVVKAFGQASLNNTTQRCDRFIEQAAQLAHQLGYSKERVHQIVDYAYSRPHGDIENRIGSVMVTFLALCSGAGISAFQATRKEVIRIWQQMDEIIEKNKDKPQ